MVPIFVIITLMPIKCLKPFVRMEFNKDGEVYFCCPMFSVQGPVGNILTDSIDTIWNGQKIREIRKKFYEGKIEGYCNAKYCPIVSSPDIVNLDEEVRKWPYLKDVMKPIKKQSDRLWTMPKIIEIADNGQCNLRCKMCISNESYIPTNPRLTKRIFDYALPALLPTSAYLNLAGNGDPIFRKESREFLQKFNPKKYPHLKVNLLTNGLLMNPGIWKSMQHVRFANIAVSVDAASELTYKNVRGGNWQILQRNLQFLSDLRKANKFESFHINFIVMRSNYKEMVDFARMGIKLGCDCVYFSKIFGVTPDCVDENIFLFNDRKIIKEIKHILKDPIFDNPRVDVNNLLHFDESIASSVHSDSYYHVKQSAYKLVFGVYYAIPLSTRRTILPLLRKLIPSQIRNVLMT